MDLTNDQGHGNHSFMLITALWLASRNNDHDDDNDDDEDNERRGRLLTCSESLSASENHVSKTEPMHSMS